MNADDKLICELLLGWKLCDCGKGEPHYKYGQFNWQVASKFEKSWERLMSIVEKVIEDKLCLLVTIEGAVVTIQGTLINSDGSDGAKCFCQSFYESHEETKKDLIYRAIAQFARWYEQWAPTENILQK